MHVVQSRSIERIGERDNEYKIYIYIYAVQKIRWPRKRMVIKKYYVILCGGRISDKHEFGTGFYISRYSMDNFGGGRGDWMELAQDRDRWRILVGMVRNF
jgi:hypothetical protein